VVGAAGLSNAAISRAYEVAERLGIATPPGPRTHSGLEDVFLDEFGETAPAISS
jgi:hypothetical protein